MCSIDHVALKQSARWAELPLVGVQRTPADDVGPAEELELKNCPDCHSTLAVLVAVNSRAA